MPEGSANHGALHRCRATPRGMGERACWPQLGAKGSPGTTGRGVPRARHDRWRRPVSGLASLGRPPSRGVAKGAKRQWLMGDPHSLTVAGAAAGWAREIPHGHRIPVSPAARDSRRTPAPKIVPSGGCCSRCFPAARRRPAGGRPPAIIVAPFRQLPPPPDDHRPRGEPVTQKLYIRTFGCQMNEYDSARMADVLAADGGYALTDRPENADVILFNTCSVREKAQERVFHDLGRVRALKTGRPDLIIGVGGCVASQEGAAIVGTCSVRRRRLRTADAPPAARAHPHAARDRCAAGRHRVPGDREIRSVTAAAGRGRFGVPVHHGRLQQVLHVLRRALHPGRGSLPAVRRRPDRGGRSRRPGRHGGHAPRAERQRLPGSDGRHYGGRRPRHADRVRRRGSRHRAHPLHDVAPERDDAAAHQGPRHHGQAGLAPASARPIGVRPGALGDEARLHCPRVQVDRPEAEARAPGALPHFGFHRRLSGRDRRRFRADDGSRRRDRFRRLVQLRVQSRARAPRQRDSPIPYRTRSSRRGSPCCRRASTSSTARTARRW